MKLLEKAQEKNRRNNQIIRQEYSQEELDLYLLWLHEDLSTGQVIHAMNDINHTKKAGNILYRIASVLREAIHRGDIKIERI